MGPSNYRSGMNSTSYTSCSINGSVSWWTLRDSKTSLLFLCLFRTMLLATWLIDFFLEILCVFKLNTRRCLVTRSSGLLLLLGSACIMWMQAWFCIIGKWHVTKKNILLIFFSLFPRVLPQRVHFLPSPCSPLQTCLALTVVSLMRHFSLWSGLLP